MNLLFICRYNNKTYRIDQIIWDKRVTDKFTLADGRELTYVEYYRETYQRVISDMDQPMVVSTWSKLVE